MNIYYRPIPQTDPLRPVDARAIGGGQTWFTHLEVLQRGQTGRRVSVQDVPTEVIDRISAARVALAGLSFEKPVIMGILNVTPDSFSDGGQHAGLDQALHHAQAMVRDGADVIDIGGESTRPGADEIDPMVERTRTEPVIEALRRALKTPISIDTRKAGVADAALAAGADIVNDVSGFTFDPALAPLCAERRAPVCVMHALGDPQTMQDNPQYDNVLLDVYDFLEQQIAVLGRLGIERSQIIVDPGIGFGKSQAHNLELLNGISLFHALGCPILLGASRKGFIRDLSPAPKPEDRVYGSIAVALAAVAQGVQIVRVHDVWETRAALNLWQAVVGGRP